MSATQAIDSASASETRSPSMWPFLDWLAGGWRLFLRAPLSLIGLMLLLFAAEALVQLGIPSVGIPVSKWVLGMLGGVYWLALDQLDTGGRLRLSDAFRRVGRRWPALAGLALLSLVVYLLQEIVFSIWKALPSFRGQASLKTFVARVAHNRAVDHVLHRQRLLDRHACGEDPAELSGAAAHSLHQRLDLASAIRRLPLHYRQCVELMLEGFSHAEIGETLGLEESAVAQRLRRGRQRLKATLAKDDSHENRS